MTKDKFEKIKSDGTLASRVNVFRYSHTPARLSNPNCLGVGVFQVIHWKYILFRNQKRLVFIVRHPALNILMADYQLHLDLCRTQPPVNIQWIGSKVHNGKARAL
jgi:hypothetical protein